MPPIGDESIAVILPSLAIKGLLPCAALPPTIPTAPAAANEDIYGCLLIKPFLLDPAVGTDLGADSAEALLFILGIDTFLAIKVAPCAAPFNVFPIPEPGRIILVAANPYRPTISALGNISATAR